MNIRAGEFDDVGGKPFLFVSLAAEYGGWVSDADRNQTLG